MHGLNTHPVERGLQRLAARIWRHPSWFIYPQLVLCGVSVFYAVLTLQFKTDTNDLVSPDVGYQQLWQGLREEFHIQDDMVTLVESSDPEKNRQFMERLAARLEGEPQLFTDIYYKGDLRAMGTKALLMLPEPELERLLAGLRECRPFVGKFVNVTNLSSLFVEVEAEWQEVLSDGAGAAQLTQALPALVQVVQQGAASLKRVGVPPSPGLTTLFAAREDPSQGGYLQVAGGRIYILTCAAPDDKHEGAAVRRLRELVDATRLEVPGVNAGITGEPVLNQDEMSQAKSDTTRASVIALVVVALTFIFCYHEVGRPLKATACLVVGLGYTVGFAALTVGHLNILTITFVPILIGLAIDFGVHLIARFEEELRSGCDAHMAMTRALVAGGTGIFTSGLTTAAAFLAMVFTGFKGIREMGVVSGGGLLVCLVPMITMLPALLLRPSRFRLQLAVPSNLRMLFTPPRRRAWHRRRERFEQLWLLRPRAVIWVGAGLTVLAAGFSTRLRFDYNPLHLQSPQLPAVTYEQRLIKSASRSILFCAMTADSVAEALSLEQRVRALPSVAEVDSVAPYLADHQERKLQLVAQIVRAAGAIRFAPMDPQPVDLTELDAALERLGRASVGAMQFAGDKLDESSRTQLTDLRMAIGEWRAAMGSISTNQSQIQLTHYQRALFQDLETSIAALRVQQYDQPMRVEDLPPGLRSRFVGHTGKYLLQIYPKGDVWEHEPRTQFVRELRSVDPTVTGAPVLFYENTRRLKSNFQVAAVYALIAISIMLMIHFRNVVCVLLSLLPVALGVLWTFGLMGWLGLAFNPANVIGPTLLIGIGVTNGIHILNRFTEEQHPSILGKSTGKAVLVSALTTSAGFGSLILAQHRGIASLGVLMAAGSALCMVAAVTVLPALLILLKRYGLKLGHGWLASASGRVRQDDAQG